MNDYYMEYIMQFFRHILSVLAITIFFTVACEYQPDGENFGKISFPDTTRTIQVELLPPDTNILLEEPVIMSYNINTSGLMLYYVNIFVDDVRIFQSNKLRDSFYFNPREFGQGDRLLTLIVFTRSHTGSLSELI